jgi:hypothetical protein
MVFLNAEFAKGDGEIAEKYFNAFSSFSSSLWALCVKKD